MNGIGNLVGRIFKGDPDILIDASVIHTLRKYLREKNYDFGEINLEELFKGIFFMAGMSKMFSKFKERIILFEKLKTEYHGVIKPTQLTIKYILERFVLGKNLERDLPNLKKVLRMYNVKLNRFEKTANNIQDFTDPRVDKLENLLVYVNTEFELKDVTTKTVDEQIIAAAILNSMLGKKTNLYTMDDGILSLAIGFSYLMSLDELKATGKVCDSSKRFITQVRKADINVWTYGHIDRIFFPIYENRKKIFRNAGLCKRISEHFKKNKNKIAEAVSECILKIYVSKT